MSWMVANHAERDQTAVYLRLQQFGRNKLPSHITIDDVKISFHNVLTVGNEWLLQ